MQRQTIVTLFIAFFGLILASPASAGVDKADAAITVADWGGTSSGAYTSFAVSSTTNMPIVVNSRTYTADSGLILSHAKNSVGAGMNHWHYKDEWGDVGQPSQAEADAYWDARFGAHKQTTRISSAIRKSQTCHEWALANSTAPGRAGGVFVYTMTTPNDQYSHMAGVAANAVSAGDILVYLDHSTLVMSVRANLAGTGNEPNVVRWKWLDSGVYEYGEPRGGYNTPACVLAPPGFPKDVDIHKDITQQGWVFNGTFRSGALLIKIAH